MTTEIPFLYHRSILNMPTEKPPQKQVSERRRMQNKQAQKNYRKPELAQSYMTEILILCDQENARKEIYRFSKILLRRHTASVLVGRRKMFKMRRLELTLILKLSRS